MRQEIKNFFEGKHITLMGLGLLGRGVGDAVFLARMGANLVVTDTKSETELAPSLAQLAAYSGVRYALNGHRLADFSDADMVIKGAGVPLDSAFIAEARKHRVPVEMSTALFVKLAGIPTVGITGTRGKSTVTHLIYEMLKRDGRETLLGGNVRGISTLALLEKVTSRSVGVLELDSWQLQGFAETDPLLQEIGVPAGPVSPHVAVFTTLMDDHVNYYKGDSAQYLADKANIFLYQEESDTLVLGRQAMEAVTKSFGKRMRSNVVIADETNVPKNWKIKLLGTHNRYNAGCALEAARAMGVDDKIIREVLETFDALPGRLSFVCETDGVAFYNDTNGTTPDATMASLYALKDAGKPVILIMGGADKKLEYDALVKILPAFTKKIVLLAGTGTQALLHAHGDMLKDAVIVSSMKDAVEKARTFAEKGDAVVMSPAFASFGMFKNEYDRGDQFEAFVRNL